MAFFDKLRRTGASAPAIAPSLALADSAGFVVVDAETTGLRPRRDRIVELAILRLDRQGTIVHEWVRRFDPEGSVGAPNLHGLTAADVVHAPLFAGHAQEIAERLSGAVVVGHTVQFDLAFLRAEFERAGWELPDLPTIDTLQASLRHLPDLDRRRLADCCAGAGVSLRGGHSALGDARATAGLMRSYLDRSPESASRDLRRQLETAASIAWPTGPAHDRRILPDDGPRRTTLETAGPTEPPTVLAELLSDFSLVDVLDEGAPPASLGHVELLAEAIEDGELDLDDHAALHDLTTLHGLAPVDLAAAHRALVLTLTHLALDDGLLGPDERTALSRLAAFLGVDGSVVRGVVDWATAARRTRSGRELVELPADGSLGEPLRVGDRVSFIGCDEHVRDRLERRALAVGVRVVGSVSSRTTMLVSDGSSAGRRGDLATRLGVRQVDAHLFARLLEHVQPGEGRPLRPTPGRHAAIAADPAGTDPALVRQWARDQGHAVGSRGRLSPHLVEAYLVARREA